MRNLRGRGGIVFLLASLIVLAGCGTFRERSICRQYEDFRTAAAQVRELDPDTATTDDIEAIANETLAELDQLQGASDGEYDSLIIELNASLTVLRQSAVDLGATDLDVARPLMRESWEDVLVDYQLLVQRLDVVCPTDA